MYVNFLKVSVAGSLFGAALAASGVYSPSIIVAQMQVKQFHMLKVFLGASASSAIIIVLFEQFGISKCEAKIPSSLGWLNKYDGNILGGLLIGMGMTLTGACPGTSLVQVTAGIRSGVFVVSGGIIGGACYIKTSKFLRKAQSQAVETKRARTVYEKLHTGRITTIAVYELTCLSIIALVTYFTNSRSDLLSSRIGGLLIGAAQAGSLLLTGNLVGVSGAYAEMGAMFWKGVDSIRGLDSPLKSPISHYSIVFAAGIMVGSWTVLASVPSLLVQEEIQISRLSALMGGFVMVFGARIAGGCTSGHGISGMSMLSVSSIITVTSMFVGGMCLAGILS